MELVPDTAKDGRITLVARLRIVLNDVEPMPMRHIEVPLKIRLDRLHEVIQAAMGWTDTHLYEFRVGDAGWGMPDPVGFYGGPMDAKKTTLEKLLDQTATRRIHYVYDFGDDWDHSIRIERVGEATPGVIYPRLLKANGACPPKTSEGPGATRCSSKPSPTRSASNTRTWSNGQAGTSMPKMPGPTASSNASIGLQRNGPRGHANPSLQSERRQ